MNGYESKEDKFDLLMWVICCVNVGQFFGDESLYDLT